MRRIRCIINTLLAGLNKKITVGKGCGLRIWKSIKCDNVSKIHVGDISVRDNCHIEAKNGGIITMGNHCNFNYNCIVVCHEKISFGNNNSIGPNVIIYDHDHDYRDVDWRNKFKTKEVKIGDNVWIGGNVTILKGTTVGNNCVIAANTTLKGETVPDNSIVYENKQLVLKPVKH